MSYLDVTEVYRQIKQALDDKQPFSLVRLGDGEARLMGYPDLVPMRELNKSLRYWYGKQRPTNTEVAQLRVELMAAVRNADVVGLPSAQQVKKNPGYKMVHYLVMLHRLATNDTCHCGVHRRLQETGLLDELLTGLESVTIITCRDVDHLLVERYGITRVCQMWVPPEAQMQEPTKKHYPDWHSKTIRELDVGPGDLVLVGAGPNGKVYCDAAKRDGAVGLDLGSVFDGWVGIRSRSYIAQNPRAYRL